MSKKRIECLEAAIRHAAYHINVLARVLSTSSDPSVGAMLHTEEALLRAALAGQPRNSWDVLDDSPTACHACRARSWGEECLNCHVTKVPEMCREVRI